MYSYRDGQNSGNSRQYRNNTVCDDCIIKNISCIFRYSFVCLRYVSPVSSHYRFGLVTVRMKVLHNRRRVRFSKRTDF